MFPARPAKIVDPVFEGTVAFDNVTVLGLQATGNTTLRPFNGDGTTKSFVVDGHGQNTITPDIQVYVDGDAISDGWSAEPITADSVTIHFGAPPKAGANNVVVKISSLDVSAGRCRLITQPFDLDLVSGDIVDFGESFVGGFVWQRSSAAEGPWQDSAPPTLAAAGDNGSWWRLFCQDDNLASDAVRLLVSPPACQITRSPSNVTGAVGDAIVWDGAATGGSIDWYYSTTGLSGPWIPVGGPPPTTLTAELDGRYYRFCCRDSGAPSEGGVCSQPASITVDDPANPGYSPANFPLPPIRTTFPDPAPADGAGFNNYRTRSATVPEVLITTGLFSHEERTSALTSSNNVAGVAYTDPLVHPGLTGGPVASMAEGMGHPHEHEYLGNVLAPNANLLDLANEPFDWQPGSDAANDGYGYRGLITDGNGQRFGYSPGFWWPRIYWDGQPVSMKRGIAIYYVRNPPSHVGERVFLLPNGVGWVNSARARLMQLPNGADWRVAVFGPRWARMDAIHVGPFPNGDPAYNDPYLSWDQTPPDDGNTWTAIAEFQSYLKMDIPPGAPEFGQVLAESPDGNGINHPLFHFGNPTDIGIPFHVDYVSGWTNQAFAQELLDRTANKSHPDYLDPRLNIKFEGWRAVWDTSTAFTPAPPDLGA